MRGLVISHRTAVASALLLLAVVLPGGCKKSCGRDAVVEYQFPAPKLSPGPIDYDCSLPPALQKMLDDGEVSTPSEGATGLLWELGHSDDPKHWEHVCWILDRDEESKTKINTRAVALERLVDIGKVDSFPILRVAVTDPEFEVRRSAFKGIASLGGDEARAFVRACRSSEDATIRRNAMIGLGLLGMFEELEDALNDSDPEVAASAVGYVERYNGEIWDRTGKRHVPVSDEVRINRYQLGASIHDGPAGEVIDSFGDFEPPDEYDYGPYMDSRRRWVYEFVKQQVEGNEEYDLIYEIDIPRLFVFLVPVRSVDEREDWRGKAQIRMKGNPDEVVALLEPLFVYEDLHYRREVIHTLVNLGGQAAVEGLALMLDDKQQYIVRHAISGLGEIGDPAALEYLVPIARNMQDCASAMRAAQALGEIGTPEAVDTLIWMVTEGLIQENDCFEDIHETGVLELPLALGKTGSEDVAPVLMELFEGTLLEGSGRYRAIEATVWMRGDAMLALGEVGGDGVLEFIQKAAGPGDSHAIVALGEMGDPSSTELLLKLSKSEAPGTRFYAGMALSALGHPDGTTILIEAREESNVGCDTSGIREYIDVYCDKFALTDKILAWMASKGDAVDKIPEITNSAYHLQEDDSLRVLVDLLDDDDVRIRGRALWELFVLTGLSFGYDQDAWNDWLTKVLKTGSLIEEHKAYQEVRGLSTALMFPTEY
jgi:HEAT repeat protein